MKKFKAHILVVDDDDRIRDLVKQYLNENNYLVTTAINAEDAQKKVDIIKFDLIVLDIMMPGKSGLEFTSENKNKLYTPIILLTAKGEAEERVHGLEIGAGVGSDGSTSDQETQYIKYTMGGITVGMQKSEIDFDAAGTNDEERDHVAVSLAVNENLSIAYGMSDVDMGTATDEESSGVSFSYTMGSMTFGGLMNKTDNVAGTSGTNDKVTELNVAFSF